MTQAAGKVSVGRALAEKPESDAVVWIGLDQAHTGAGAVHVVRRRPGRVAADIAGYPNPRRATHNAEGVRPVRKNHHILPPAAFTKLKTLDEIVVRLFGELSGNMTSSALIPFTVPDGLTDDNGAKAPALFLQEARAAERFFDFFTANIRNKHTRRAYYNAACKFSEFCAERGVHDLAHVKPVHVAGYIESLREGFAKPTIKQHLAAIRMLFDWLVVGQIIDVNPAHAVRGPKHVVNKGRTPVLNREEARALLSPSIPARSRACAIAR